ncbi:type II secretion system protein [Candidatus Collierbacteria bacterium]|nr:type II secretion system protein [Candidatus Collierbacteria bacterium]
MSVAKIKAFSLIEVIITTAILGILFGGIMVNMFNFKNKRQVMSDAMLVADFLTKVRTKAAAVEVPAGCTGISDYQVGLDNDLVSGLGYFKADVNCAVGSVLSYLPRQDLYSSKITLSPGGDIYFLANGKVSEAKEILICGQNGEEYRLELFTTGAVEGPEYNGNCSF